MAKKSAPPTPDASFLRLMEGQDVELLAAEKSSADGPRRFKMVAYSGQPVQRFFGRMVIDLAGVKTTPERTPILRNHDPNQVVGMSESIRVEPAGIIIEGKLSRRTAAAREVMELSDENFRWQASIGMEVIAVERLDLDVKATVNGRELTGPAYIVRQSKLRESSFVPVGADGDTSGVVLSFFDKEDVSMPGKEENPAPAPAAPSNELVVERQRVAALKAAFPKDVAFALDALEKGWSLQEAKAAYADKLQADMDAKDKAHAAELAIARKGTAAPKPVGPAPVSFAGDPAPAGDKDFLALTEEHRAKHGGTWEAAALAVSRAHPDLHEKYRDESRSTQGRKVERLVAK